MRNDEMAGVRGLLTEFVREVFASLPRKDQRGKGGLYLQALLLDGKRKSMQPMGERLGIDYQQLQQFVSSSPWPVEPVRRALVARAVDLIRPEAWAVDDTGFKKDGTASPGVARQYSGTPGSCISISACLGGVGGRVDHDCVSARCRVRGKVRSDLAAS